MLGGRLDRRTTGGHPRGCGRQGQTRSERDERDPSYVVSLFGGMSGLALREREREKERETELIIEIAVLLIK